MAIFLCSKCEHAREVGIDYVGKSVKCPKCKKSVVIHDTITFARALIKSNMSQTLELQELRKGLTTDASSNKQEEPSLLDGIDVQNTNILTQENNFLPIVEWFDKKNIKAQIDPSAVDTTGFFDEVALLLGKNFNELSHVTSQIKYIQNKGYTNVKIDLSKRDANESKQIKDFCNTLYDYSCIQS